MQGVYKFFVYFCAAQMALSMLILANGSHCRLTGATLRKVASPMNDYDSCVYDEPRPKSSLPNSTRPASALPRNFEIAFHVYPLEACVVLTSVFATSFAALYMQLQDRTEMMGDELETLCALITWAFCATQFTAMLALAQGGAVIAVDAYLLQIFINVFGLAVACGTPPKMPLWTLGLMLLPVGQLLFAMMQACTQTSLVVLVMQLNLEILLFIGHRWDAKVSLVCLQNGRLCYITGGCFILQVGMILQQLGAV